MRKQRRRRKQNCSERSVLSGSEEKPATDEIGKNKRSDDEEELERDETGAREVRNGGDEFADEAALDEAVAVIEEIECETVVEGDGTVTVPKAGDERNPG